MSPPILPGPKEMGWNASSGFGSANPGFVPAPDYYPPQDVRFRGAGGLQGTMTPQAEAAFNQAQQGFQAGLEAPAGVGKEAQFANPRGISPEHAGEKASTYQAPPGRTGGACIQWVDFHGVTIPQPGGSLKDCAFDWVIGAVAALIVIAGVLFLLKGSGASEKAGQAIGLVGGAK